MIANENENNSFRDQNKRKKNGWLIAQHVQCKRFVEEKKVTELGSLFPQFFVKEAPFIVIIIVVYCISDYGNESHFKEFVPLGRVKIIFIAFSAESFLIKYRI